MNDQDELQRDIAAAWDTWLAAVNEATTREITRLMANGYNQDNASRLAVYRVKKILDDLEQT